MRTIDILCHSHADCPSEKVQAFDLPAVLDMKWYELPVFSSV